MKESFNSPKGPQTHTSKQSWPGKEVDAGYIWDYMSIISVTEDSGEGDENKTTMMKGAPQLSHSPAHGHGRAA